MNKFYYPSNCIKVKIDLKIYIVHLYVHTHIYITNLMSEIKEKSVYCLNFGKDPLR